MFRAGWRSGDAIGICYWYMLLVYAIGICYWYCEWLIHPGPRNCPRQCISRRVGLAVSAGQ